MKQFVIKDKDRLIGVIITEADSQTVQEHILRLKENLNLRKKSERDNFEHLLQNNLRRAGYNVICDYTEYDINDIIRRYPVCGQDYP